MATRRPRRRRRSRRTRARTGGFVLAVALGVGCIAAACAFGVHAIGPVPVVDDAEALARVIRSECGVCSPHERVHVAWATRNLAAERDQTIARMACAPCGEQQAGRPVSSRQDATELDRSLARHVLDAPAVADPTGGATHFINPRLQDTLAAGDHPGYRGRPYAVVHERWRRVFGWEPYYRLAPHLELWGPARDR